MLETLKKYSVLELPVHLSDDYASWLRSRIEQNIGTHVVTLNAEMAMLSEQNDVLANIIRKADLVIPDGSGVIFYLRLHNQSQQRCPGIELAASVLQQTAQMENSDPVVFYGGAPGVTQKAAEFWQQQLPGLSILAYHGYLNDTEEREFKQLLADKQPRLILVGLGVPRQEIWISQNRSLCPNATWIGVGGSFDIWSGIKTRAPMWLRDNHMEWLYRLYQEPWRWRRMLVLPKFALRAIAMGFKNSSRRTHNASLPVGDD
ncbi:WecB/TagA/CpsF family glycosyltransferase [Lusitaniella coriacea LEGE 07157]|uniref:WecB/TagA/CpsF family glycosyltransferase n=1 Tax=Lusitaniella coriacea LEGE 07157 TaxID=945747 RepID=A0A8J7DV48_9CYAN|nr:WecB/TagA/CpsF family glycosyltransferase [Lusitaniella coriacea]MBE9115584.1 WecB/TagA/CpsF family glycosyltransferase [Lusitaniella coriacea LEGE 07157]